MARLLLIIAIVIVAFLIVKRLTRPSSQAGERSPSENAAKPAEDKLVRCVQCGAFVRKADALPDPRGFRCTSPECAKSNLS
jgi:hypothetical protein